MPGSSGLILGRVAEDLSPSSWHGTANQRRFKPTRGAPKPSIPLAEQQTVFNDPF